MTTTAPNGFAPSLGVSHQFPEMLTPEHMAYLRQMGVESVEVRAPADYCTQENIQELKNRVEDAGLRMHELMMSDYYNFHHAAVGLENARYEIDLFKEFLVKLGKAGIDMTTYCWHTGGIYATGTTKMRGCVAREFILGDALAEPNVYGKAFPEDLVWDNYEAFIKEVLPVAEDNGVHLQLHPNDPPVDHQGVPRLFKSRDAYRRAMEIANHNPYSGILFCAGSFSQMFGPDGNGEDVPAAIREFGSQGHIFQIHYRNVSSTLPDFHETFPDNGYQDMDEIMRALGDVGFNGHIVPDHVPEPENSKVGFDAAEAYILGFMRAMIVAETKRQRLGVG